MDLLTWISSLPGHLAQKESAIAMRNLNRIAMHTGTTHPYALDVCHMLCIRR